MSKEKLKPFPLLAEARDFYRTAPFGETMMSLNIALITWALLSQEPDSAKVTWVLIAMGGYWIQFT